MNSALYGNVSFSGIQNKQINTSVAAQTPKSVAPQFGFFTTLFGENSVGKSEEQGQKLDLTA